MKTKTKTTWKLSPKLPEMAYVAVETETVLCLIKKGEKGYHRTDYAVGVKKSITPEQFAAEMNRRLGVTPVQAEAMVLGSMCGWGVPGADPDYVESSKMKRAMAKTRRGSL